MSSSGMFELPAWLSTISITGYLCLILLPMSNALITTISRRALSYFPFQVPSPKRPQTHPSSSAARRRIQPCSSFPLQDPNSLTNLHTQSSSTYAPRSCTSPAHQHPRRPPSLLPSHE